MRIILASLAIVLLVALDVTSAIPRGGRRGGGKKPHFPHFCLVKNETSECTNDCPAFMTCQAPEGLPEGCAFPAGYEINVCAPTTCDINNDQCPSGSACEEVTRGDETRTVCKPSCTVGDDSTCPEFKTCTAVTKRDGTEDTVCKPAKCTVGDASTCPSGKTCTAVTKRDGTEDTVCKPIECTDDESCPAGTTCMSFTKRGRTLSFCKPSEDANEKCRAPKPEGDTCPQHRRRGGSKGGRGGQGPKGGRGGRGGPKPRGGRGGRGRK